MSLKKFLSNQIIESLFDAAKERVISAVTEFQKEFDEKPAEKESKEVRKSYVFRANQSDIPRLIGALKVFDGAATISKPFQQDKFDTASYIVQTALLSEQFKTLIGTEFQEL